MEQNFSHRDYTCFENDDISRVGTTKIVLLIIIGIPLILFGIIGNVVAVVVLSRKLLRSGISIILAALAVHDVLMSFIYLMPMCVYYLSTYFGWTTAHHIFIHYTLVEYPIHMWLYTGSVYLTVAVVFEGLLSVPIPQIQRFVGCKKVALVQIVLVTTLSLIFNLPHCFNLTVHDKEHCPDNSWNKYSLRPAKGFGGPLKMIYHAFLAPLVNIVWPYFLLWVVTVLSIILLTGILKRFVRSRETGRCASADRTEGPQRNGAAAMPLATFIGIAVLFLVCEFISLFLAVFQMVSNPAYVLGWHVYLNIVVSFVFTLLHTLVLSSQYGVEVPVLQLPN